MRKILAFFLVVAAMPTATIAQTPAEIGAVLAVVKGNTAFASDLHRELGRTPGNLCFSPWSISTVLAMTSAGADGQTLAQMNKTLHLPEARLTHPGFAALLKQMKQPTGCELNFANALFVGGHIRWNKNFMDGAGEHFGSSMFGVDFRTAPESARASINAWVEGQTKKRIANLLPAGSVTDKSMIVLVNAVYFKGAWDKPFMKEDTKPIDFFRTRNETVKAPMMFQANPMLYGENKDVQVLAMPFRGGDLMMVFVLPRERHGLAALEKDLTGEHFETWIRRLEAHPEVLVYLPRFKLTSEFALKETLSKMGMADAFGPGANFSKMTTELPPMISEVRHRALVELQEEGTEAAAATAVAAVPGAPPGAFTPPPPRPVFRADHPFLFSIVDRRSGSLVFVGRVSDPTK